MSSFDMLGSRIRNIREMKHLTREEVCRDEAELSVRQLARIEKGESLPNLKTLVFLARELNQKIEALLNPLYLYEYDNLKKQIELFSIDYNDEKNQKIDSSLMIIYEKYYHNLPIDERVYIDCSAASHEIRKTCNLEKAKVILNKYRDFLILKEKYSVNELAYIALDMWMSCLENRVIEIEQSILNIHTHLEKEDYLSIELTTRIQVNVASYFYRQNNYQTCLEILECAENFAHEKKVFQRIPIIHMLKAKCFKVLNRSVEFEESYQNAIHFAKMLHLKGLAKNIEKEFEDDRATT